MNERMNEQTNKWNDEQTKNSNLTNVQYHKKNEIKYKLQTNEQKTNKWTIKQIN